MNHGHSWAQGLVLCDPRAKDGFDVFKGPGSGGGGGEEVVGSACGLQSLCLPSGPLKVKFTTQQASTNYPARCW